MSAMGDALILEAGLKVESSSLGDEVTFFIPRTRRSLERSHKVSV